MEATEYEETAELEARVLALVHTQAAARRAVEIAEEMVACAEGREAAAERALIEALDALRARSYAERRAAEARA